MKKIYKLGVLIILMVFPFLVHAQNATISVTSAGTVVQGNTINVTVSLSGGASWDMLLNYDSSYLQLISGGGESGGNKMVNTTSGNSSRSYSFKFKALKTGSTTLKVNSYDVVADDFSQVAITSYGKTISIITQAELEASYSKNNDLKNLVVEGYEISPTFNKDTLEYSVTVPEDVTEVDVKAYVADNRSSVTGEGKLAVELGNNKFDIVVKAQNGSEKTYILNVEVKDSNPIEVEVDNEKFTLVKVAKALTQPNGYSETKVKIHDIEIPAFYSDMTKLTLVGLKDSDGKVSLYIYDNDNYKKYVELSFGNITIYVVNHDLEMEGYITDKCRIQDNEIDCLIQEKVTTKPRYRVIYGINVETNEEGYYLYDTKDKTLIKYDNEYLDTIKGNMKLLMYATIALGLTTFISLIVIINLISKKSKKVKNNKIHDKIEQIEEDISKEEIIEDQEEKEITEIVSDETEEYDDSFLSEKEKKKNKKKRK